MEDLPKDANNFPIQAFSPTIINIVNISPTPIQIDLSSLVAIRLFGKAGFQVKLYNNGDYGLETFEYGLVCGSIISKSKNVNESDIYIEVKSVSGTFDIQVEKM